MKVKSQKTVEYNLVLSQEELEAMVMVLSRVGGCPDTSIRKLTKNILDGSSIIDYFFNFF